MTVRSAPLNAEGRNRVQHWGGKVSRAPHDGTLYQQPTRHLPVRRKLVLSRVVRYFPSLVHSLGPHLALRCGVQLCDVISIKSNLLIFRLKLHVYKCTCTLMSQSKLLPTKKQQQSLSLVHTRVHILEMCRTLGLCACGCAGTRLAGTRFRRPCKEESSRRLCLRGQGGAWPLEVA